MRIVIKIGSSSLTTKQHLDLEKIQDHVDAIAALKNNGHEVLLVSSGAVAAGFKKLGYPSRPVTLKGKQAAAAIGQSILIQHYSDCFEHYKMQVAQILLTKDDFVKKKRFQNAYATLTELLDRGIIPIINENDTVSTDELSFGDNDMLSSLLAAHIHADYLIILTDINGLYTANPKTDPTAIKLHIIEHITEDLMNMAGESGSKVGTGGMESKLSAAKYATHNGVETFIGVGQGKEKFIHILNQNGDGTYFKKTAVQKKSIHRWLAFTNPKGKAYIDEGAYHAIKNEGKSLLYAGIQKFEGHFEIGDVVEVYFGNELVGRGEVEISSEQLRQLVEEKQKTEMRSTIFIHRNYWVKA